MLTSFFNSVQMGCIFHSRTGDCFHECRVGRRAALSRKRRIVCLMLGGSQGMYRGIRVRWVGSGIVPSRILVDAAIFKCLVGY